jgi:uncharacterized protein
MRFIKFLLVGMVFGIVMVKSEAISWYRIQEMFRFQAFHMYGIIGMAVVLGVIGIQLIKKFNLKDTSGSPIEISPKEKLFKSALYGGIIFGLGWALSGACPGPMVVSIGDGYVSFIVVVLFAILGTYVYGYFKDKLPH